MYCRFYLAVDKDSFQMATVFAGLFPALALSLLLWVYFYTAQNEAEEQRLADILVLSSSHSNNITQEEATSSLLSSTTTAEEQMEF